MMMNRFVVVVAVLLIGGPAVDAKCARNVPTPVILTTRDTNIPDDGGVLVGWQIANASNLPEPSGDPSDQPEWNVSAGTLRRESVAPGLSVYFLSGTGDVSIMAKDKSKLGTFHHAPKAAPKSSSAPEVAKMTLSTSKEFRWSDRHAIVTLKSAPPPSAVAVVVYSKTTALSFVKLPDTHDKLLEIETFIDHGHCGLVVDGARPPNAGEEIAIKWVDGFGRISAASNFVKAQ